MFEIPLVFAFSAGLVAAFNPCGAAMLPAYIGYQMDGINLNDNPVIASFKAILMGLSVTMGFIVVFGAMGLILAGGGRLIGQFLPFAGLGVGISITVLGGWLLVSRHKLGMIAASRVNMGSGRGLKQVFLFGIAYAIASLSCALPIFLAAVGIVAGHSLSTGRIIETIVGSIAYGLGMGVVMVMTTLGVVFFKGIMTIWMRKVFPFIEPVGNLAMIGAGVYLTYYWAFGDGKELLIFRGQQLFG